MDSLGSPTEKINSQVLSLLTCRRSVRHFQNIAVKRELVEQVLDLACWAPSAHNEQPWRFVVIENQLLRQRFAQALADEYQKDLLKQGHPAGEIKERVIRSQTRIIEAPVAIVLCLAQEDVPIMTSPHLQEEEHILAIQSAALAGGYLLLAAKAVGLASVWMCAPLYAQEITCQVLDIPSNWLPQALLLLGYAAHEPPAPARKPIQDIARFL